MAPAPLSLLALDVDGTLLDSQHRLSDANRDAIRALARRGVQVVLATGRRYDFVRPIAEQLGCEPLLICSNGAVVRTCAGRILASRLLPAARAGAVIQALDRWRHCAVLTFPVDGMGQLCMESAESGARDFPGWFERNRVHMRFCRPLESALDVDPVQIMYGGTVAAMRRLLDHLEPLASGALGVRVARTLYPQRDLGIVDILEAGVTKGAALAQWAAAAGIDARSVLAIGDNFNDVEMLEFAAHAVVMGNADASLRRPGWLRTSDNDHDGVAAALAPWLDRFSAS